MTALQMDTDDKITINQAKELLMKTFHCKVEVVNDLRIAKITKENAIKKSKWGSFAQRMSGLTTPEITEHINKTSNEMRHSTELRELSVK